jgi:biofilm PGA synthesis N-glycosyltransferase PgaC
LGTPGCRLFERESQTLDRHVGSAGGAWWGWLWILISAATIGVALNELGIRTTLRCLPGWFILQTITGPITTWWLVQEWVLGRHLTTWTGRHGRKPTLTPMTPQRKKALTTAALAGVTTLAMRRIKTHRTPRVGRPLHS